MEEYNILLIFSHKCCRKEGTHSHWRNIGENEDHKNDGYTMFSQSKDWLIFVISSGFDSFVFLTKGENDLASPCKRPLVGTLGFTQTLTHFMPSLTENYAFLLGKIAVHLSDFFYVKLPQTTQLTLVTIHPCFTTVWPICAACPSCL